MSAVPAALDRQGRTGAGRPGVIAGLFLLLALASAVSLAVGHELLTPAQLFNGLRALGGDDPDARILRELRLPRTLAALMGGAALGLAGLLLQTLFRNPLADAWSLGFMAGGQFGAALVVVAGAVVGPAALSAISALAGVGIVAGSAVGMLAVASAMSALANRVHTVTLLVLGLMLGFLAQGLISILLHFTSRTQSRIFASWNDATFANVVWGDFPTLLPPILVAAAGAVWMAKPLTALLLGETYARSVGVHVGRLRRLVLAAAILLAAPVTAYCGPIAFVGLIVPHLARGIFRSADIGVLVAPSLALGALIAVAADLAVHLPWRQHFLHLNAILALVGAPAVIGLLLRGRRTGAGA